MADNTTYKLSIYTNLTLEKDQGGKKMMESPVQVVYQGLEMKEVLAIEALMAQIICLLH